MMKGIKLIGLVLVMTASLAQAQQANWPLLPDSAAKSQGQESTLLIGSFYYFYLNEDYQSALNVLGSLRAQETADSATLDVLETSLLLALGVNDRAQMLLERITKTGGAVPAKAWFYLAKRYQHAGQWDKCAFAISQAVDNSSAPLEEALWQEALYISVTSLLELERYANAKVAFELMAPNTQWKGLALHNMLANRVAYHASIAEIRRLMSLMPYSLETGKQGELLKDRLNLLAGIYMQGSGRFAQAEMYLAKVRQQGPFAAPALLEYGWALLEQSRYLEALQPWRELLENYQSWHPASIEALLAVPHTLELMNATTQALFSYQKVEQRLQTLLVDLQQLDQPQTIQTWLESWLRNQQGQWGWRRQQLEDPIYQDKMNQALMPLLVQPAFQEQLAQLYDLTRIEQDLSENQRQLNLWLQTVQMRKTHLTAVNGKARLAQLQAQQDALLKKIEQLQTSWLQEQQTLFAYASGIEKQQMVRLDQVIPLVKGLQQVHSPTRDLNSYKERWRRSRGVLLWQLYDKEPGRSWQASVSFWQLAMELDLLGEQLQHSSQMLVWADGFWQGLEARIHSAQTQIVTLKQQVAQAKTVQRGVIATQVHTQLDRQRQQLDAYQAQARLALARLYDDTLQDQLAQDDLTGERP